VVERKELRRWRSAVVEREKKKRKVVFGVFTKFGDWLAHIV